jgi:hypothetical protein
MDLPSARVQRTSRAYIEPLLERHDGLRTVRIAGDIQLPLEAITNSSGYVQSHSMAARSCRKTHVEHARQIRVVDTAAVTNGE